MSTAQQNRTYGRALPWELTTKPPDGIQRISLPDRLFGWIIPVTVLLLWELLARLGVLPPNWLPAPSVVGKTIYQLAVAGDLFKHAGITLARVAVGFLLGASVGTLLGGLTGYLPGARKLLDPSLQALRSVPSIAWVPLFLLWLGIQETSKIALISVGAFFPVYLNLSVAMRHVDPKLLEVGKLYRLSSSKWFVDSFFQPHCLSILSGFAADWVWRGCLSLLRSCWERAAGSDTSWSMER